MIGSLVYEDYIDLYNSKYIESQCFSLLQIQPSSLDLSLSEECYEIKYSFLSTRSKVREKLNALTIKQINLEEGYVFEVNKTYLIRLNEKLKLKDNIFGYCNPKSSTGRLDIFCRTIVDFANEYENIPKNYNGEIFLEVTSKSFNIEFKKGDKLNQLRLAYVKNNYISDLELEKFNSNNKIIFSHSNNNNKFIDNGLKVSVDLSDTKNPVAYRAKNNTPNLKFSKFNSYKIEDFWIAIYSKNSSILIEKNKFYILKSKEKVRIPPLTAGVMIPYDTGIGDFRAHYAGFFDPGFGDPAGSFAVLEVKTYEIPFLIEDGQTIARIKYEKLNKNSNVVYGLKINSNYQNQGLKLSKHFLSNE